MTDLTERLAAKLWPADLFQYERIAVAEEASRILPLLLSEPELVAGLAPEAKREVLRLLLGERLGAVVNWDGDVRFERYGNAVLVSCEEVLKVLAPLEAP